MYSVTAQKSCCASVVRTMFTSASDSSIVAKIRLPVTLNAARSKWGCSSVEGSANASFLKAAAVIGVENNKMEADFRRKLIRLFSLGGLTHRCFKLPVECFPQCLQLCNNVRMLVRDICTFCSIS